MRCASALILAGSILLPACSSLARPAQPSSPSIVMESGNFLGLRTAIYRVPDLERAKVWYTQATGIAPYFDEPFYVGFDVGGYELGLLPAEGEANAGETGVVAYWGVEDVDAALRGLLAVGATAGEGVQDVGGGIRLATVRDLFGNDFGIIENPNFRAR